MNRELLVNVIWWVLLISFGRFLSYFGSHFVSGRRSVAGYTTDETYKMEAKEPERWQKVNIPSMSTETVGINRTHLNIIRRRSTSLFAPSPNDKGVLKNYLITTLSYARARSCFASVLRPSARSEKLKQAWLFAHLITTFLPPTMNRPFVGCITRRPCRS